MNCPNALRWLCDRLLTLLAHTQLRSAEHEMEMQWLVGGRRGVQSLHQHRIALSIRKHWGQRLFLACQWGLFLLIFSYRSLCAVCSSLRSHDHICFIGLKKSSCEDSRFPIAFQGLFFHPKVPPRGGGGGRTSTIIHYLGIYHEKILFKSFDSTESWLQ